MRRSGSPRGARATVAGQRRIRTGFPQLVRGGADPDGCSVRSLQLGFRRFRETSPLLAIRQARLEAAHDAMCSGTAGSTVTEVAQRFGFANAGRFTRLYQAAFGERPVEVLRRGH